MSVRVRFAPSPTGYLHVGGLRTALYNYLFARRNGGTFVLRIEDTDRARYVEGAVENLIQTLAWAGLDYDEGPLRGGPGAPYVQSERTEIYRSHARQLIDKGRAYYAFDTAAELEEMRKSLEKQGLFPRYDRRALTLTPDEVQSRLASGVPAVVRMKIPDSTTIAFDDIIRGRVEFSSEQIDDQVLLKSDGFPTYHLANVVDDHLMGISHVIRGEEWLSSTPKHVLLYQYFGWDLPAFAHLPLLLNPDKSKLSKRQGDVAVEDYKQKGYLREALVNFVAFLGWNPGDEREIFFMDQLVKEFSLERVGKSGAVFNVDKLNWLNQQHLKLKSNEELAVLIKPYVQAHQIEKKGEGYFLKVIGLLKERIAFPKDFVEMSAYFFDDPESVDDAGIKKYWEEGTNDRMRVLADRLGSLSEYSHASIETTVRQFAEELQMKPTKLIHPARLALSGRTTGPGLFEMMELLGQETVVRRLRSAAEKLKAL